MVLLNLASEIKLDSMAAFCTSLQSAPSHNANEDLALASDVAGRVSASDTSAALDWYQFLECGADLVFGFRGGDGDDLDECGVDDLLGRVRSELHEVGDRLLAGAEVGLHV